MKLTSGENSVMSTFEIRSAEGPKSKKLLFLNQSIPNPNLYNLSKNQLFRSIGKGVVWVFLLFDLDKGMFFPYLYSKLSLKVEIRYVDLIGTTDVYWEY